jgi:hypothetical protein
MSELLKKYESLDQTKLNEGTIKILNRVKTITADFTADDAKNNKIAEDVLNEVMKKNPNAVKIVKRTAKAKPTSKKVAKAKAPATTSTAKSSGNNIMSVAKEIRKAGETFKDAMERAKQVLKERKEGVVAKKKTELEKLYALVKTKKELQGFSKSDIERDAVRDAKPRGARVVTKAGFTSNQHGRDFANKLGRKYWETRDRHADRLAPNYPKGLPKLASGGAVSNAPFSVEIFKTKLRFDNELTSSSKGDLPTFAKAKEFAIDMIDNGNYYAYIVSKNGYLWGVDSKGVEQFANGGSFAPNVSNGTQFMGDVYAKGGEISIYNLRKGDKVKTRKGYIETILRRTGSGSYETIENEYTHSPESLEFVSRPSRKMANGGGIDGGMNNLTIQEVSFANGGNMSNEEKLLKELRSLQRDLNSSRLGTYIEGDNSEEQKERNKEREVKLARFNEVLKTLRESDAKFADGGSLPFMTDPNFGDFQNTGAFADGGYFDKLEEVKFVFNVGEKIKIPQIGSKGKLELLDAEIIEQYPAEQNDGTYYPFYYVKGMWENSGKMLYDEEKLLEYGNNPKNSFELGGAFVMTDLAGHSGGGTEGLNADMPLSGVSGTYYTGLVGETGAMSSGELFEAGGALHSDHTDNPLKYLSLMGAKTYGNLNYSTTKNGIDYHIGRKKDKNGDNVAIVVAFIDDENKYMIEREDAKEMSETAREMGVDKVQLYTNYGVELHTTQKPQMLGFDKIYKVSGKYESGGAMMANQQVINGASQNYVITESFGNPAQQLGMLAKGGAIKNQYEGRIPEDIWDNLTIEQREHFISDHSAVIKYVKRNYKGIKDYHLITDEIKHQNNNWKNLDSDIKLIFKEHIQEGQYAYGGKTKKGVDLKEVAIESIAQNSATNKDAVRNFVNENNLSESEITALAMGVGRQMITKDFVTALVGRKNNPYVKKVVAFTKSGNAYRMSDGGSFAPNVADGTQFMNVVYAKGGKIKIGGDDFTFLLELSDKELQKRLDLVNKQKSINAEQYFKAKDKKENTSKIEEAGARLDNQWYAILEARNRKNKKYADGGSFAPNVSDGTQFMNGVYADGGAINGMLNKKIQKLAEKKGLTMDALGRDEYNKVMTQALVESLTDANFHEEAKQVVVKAEGKTKWSDELYRAESFNPDADVASFAREVSRECEWTGDDILNAFFFVTKMEGSKVASMIDNLFLSKNPRTKVIIGNSKKPSKYIDHDDIKSVTVKYKGKEVIFKGEDVLNGANLMEDGGDLSDKAFYIPKRDVVEVELKDGSKIKPVNGYWIKKGSEPMGKKNTTPKIDETKAHFQADALGNVFVDSNFVNQSQGNLPNTELKHYGFGDFYLQTPDGNIDFIRTSEEKEGFVGRSHKMKGSDELVLKLVNAMKGKGRFESTQTFANGGSFAPNVSDGTAFMGGVYADGGEMQGNNIDAELEDFDLNNLDPFETMQYNNFVKSSGKVDALQILINIVEGDYTQLSPELAELAEMQMSSEEYDEATRQMRFERDGYANGGEIRRFNRQEQMDSKTREEVLDIVSEPEVSGVLTNYLYGLFDGYDYSETEDFKKELSKLKSKDSALYDRVNNIYKIIDKYKFEKYDEYANGGSMGSGIDPIKAKVVMAVGFESAMEFYDAEYPIRPIQLLQRAVRGGYITLDEINERVVDSAMETAQDTEDMEEVGSSDFGAYLRDFLDEAGFKVGYVNGRLTREYADGGFMNNVYADGGVMAKGGMLVYLDGEKSKSFKTKKSLYEFVRSQTGTGVKKVEIDYGNRIIPTFDTYVIEDGKLIHKGELIQKNYNKEDAEKRRLETERNINQMLGYADGGFMNNVYAKGGSLNIMENIELKTFVNSLFNRAKNKIANDKGHSLFVLSSTVIATKDSLGNPKFYLGVNKGQNSRPTYVVGSGFLSSEMLVYESYKKDLRFLETESIVEAKKFLTDKVKKQILHLKDRSVMADGGSVGDMVLIELNSGKVITGKLEKLNPVKIRTNESSTQVLPNALIKSIKKISYADGGFMNNVYSDVVNCLKKILLNTINIK